MGLREAWAALLGTGLSGYPIEMTTWNPVDIAQVDVNWLWETQPHLRTVVTFLARNVAQLGLQAFQRVSDTDRQRVHAPDPLAVLLNRPNGHDTMYEVIFRLVADMALHDEAFIIPQEVGDGQWILETLPASWCIRRGGTSALSPQWFQFQSPNGAAPFQVDAADLIWFSGYDPYSLVHGSSPINSLKYTLLEQVEAAKFRSSVWMNAGRVGGYLTRPVGARWDPQTREKFARDWQAKFGRDGSRPGGTPILEDGMEYKRPGYSAKEDEFVEGTKLAFMTVCSAYHVNPTMVGILDNANFSNVREFRKMLYGDTLGPILADLEARLNQFLVPLVTPNPDMYVEFNINEKLQGSFDEQTAALQSSVGRPWMTANEARALWNLPALDGDADELVTPLNVLVGGLASPNDTAPTGGTAAAEPLVSLGELQQVKQVRVKSQTGAETWGPRYAKLLSDFYKRQGSVVLSAMGAKAPSWWDQDRWDKELGDDIFKLSLAASTTIAHQHAVDMGLDPDQYEQAWTTAYLRKAANERAQMVNNTTYNQLSEAEPDEADDVFANAESTRTHSGGYALAAAVAGFATSEFAHQYFGTKAQKTWITGPNPRASHAEMDGETVGNDEVFSNGAKWPGDPTLGASEVAGCNCGLEISF
jgi:HK97 family phage portal protein